MTDRECNEILHKIEEEDFEDEPIQDYDWRTSNYDWSFSRPHPDDPDQEGFYRRMKAAVADDLKPAKKALEKAGNHFKREPV
jgi:hypothetical protein